MAKQKTARNPTSSLQSNPDSPNQNQSSPRRRSSRVKKPIQIQPVSNPDSDEEEEENIPSSPSSDHHRKKSKKVIGSKKPVRTRKTPIKKPKAKSTTNQNPKRNQAQENDHDLDEGVRSDRELGNHVKSDYIISQDNDLFNSIQKGSSAIEPTLEDWIEMYKGKDSNETDSNEEARAEAIALMINCILRCCGCNNSIDKDEALDLDAVPERLDDIQEEFKKYAFFYLTNQSQHALSDQTSMTTSSLRSIRHTSTFVCLFGLMSSFIDILIQVSIEFNQLNKKVTDLKSKSHNNNRSTSDERLNEWEKRKSLVGDQKESLENHINDFFDGVFVHRYRDSDPKIRIECVQALGQWMNQLPDHFLGGHYLRYLGWVLTDTLDSKP
ncbi:uncharacterized protein MELLADRAFT_86915 [Melampsora larici-populina 98AG31]|uniref:SCD domain-containing protein n=1 Tax=Melampsora larici-populina (strain 98AG31 / pathotype 3-4-7) TaxID=747676 RepID=F4R3U6_MELLP|nr:uncharacterized protein MELLADRAFT_86915 [Melampsora larici-populina 98AG31]EGG13104.1 hypothetical protein MELLADRAFT_86915 [Melampsora larici-populina 98AG31]